MRNDNGKIQEDSVLDKLLNSIVNLCLVSVSSENVTLLKAPKSIKAIFNGPINYYKMCELAISKHADPNFIGYIEEKIQIENILNHLKDNNVYRFSFKILNQDKYCEIVYVKLDYQDDLLMGFQFLNHDRPSDKEQIQKRKEELKRERMFLDVLSRKYASVYYVDLNLKYVEILKMDNRTNNVLRFKNDSREKLDYEKMVQEYCDRFVEKPSKEIFKRTLDVAYLKEKLTLTNRIVQQFITIPNSFGQHHLQLQIFRVNENEFDGTAIFAFQFIDDILSKEQIYQARLQETLQKEIDNLTVNNFGHRYVFK